MAAVIALVAILGYCGSRSVNTVTGEVQYVNLTPEQEIALGLQAAPEMAQQFGGLYPDQQAQTLVDEVGQKIVQSSDARNSPYQFEFHLLDDQETINAFALPGGQIFITAALLLQLESEAQLAGVLGHEVGHVVGRHSAERIQQQQLAEGLSTAAILAASDPSDPNSQAAQKLAQMVSSVVQMKFGREDELESDQLGVRFIAQAGYDPRALIGVMGILAEAAGPNRQPEFFSTHPNPENRIENIEAAIQAEFPNGVPEGLIP